MYILFHQKETSYSRWHLCQILTDFYWQIIYEICSKTATKNPTTHCICCHTTLWNINVRKQAINDKFQGSVATYLKRGGLSIITLRKVYCWVRVKIFLNRWIFGKVTTKKVVVSCTLCVWPPHCLIWFKMIPPHPKYVTTVPCNLSLITTLVCDCRSFFSH